jgi:hypothetical protein
VDDVKDKIEVTEAMIEAGVNELRLFDPKYEYEATVMVALFSAMIKYQSR